MSEIEKYYNGEIHIDFDDEIEELKADIEEYRDRTTWWSNRFNAVERNNRELRQEIERLNNLLKETSQTLSEQTTKAITLKSENERLNNIIKEIEKCIDYYAIENEDFSKYYNNEEIEILKIIGSDKE